jgi:hypothetical protein
MVTPSQTFHLIDQAGLQRFLRAFYTARPQILALIIHLSLHDVHESVYNDLPADFLFRLLTLSRNIRCLDLSPGFLISYIHIKPVSSFHKELTTLSLAGVTAISSATLAQFLSFFPSLRRLDLSGTAGVTPTLFSHVPASRLCAIRLRHQPYSIDDSTVRILASALQSNLSGLDLSFALKSITGGSISALEKFCQARPPAYTSQASMVDIGPGPRQLGVAYTSVPLSSISRFISSEMVHLTALDIAGIPAIPNWVAEFWHSLRRGSSFISLEGLRVDFSVFEVNAGFRICLLPTRLKEFTLHNVPPIESRPARVINTIVSLLRDLWSLSQFKSCVLDLLNLEMAPKEDEQDIGMYAVTERYSGDEIDVVEGIKQWKRSQTNVWKGQIRVIRDVVGIRTYAQEFGDGVGDILGQWLITPNI